MDTTAWKKRVLKKEIFNNVREIYYRIWILGILLKKYLLGTGGREQKLSYEEYDNYWGKFWESKDIFRKDLDITNNGVLSSRPISPYEFRQKVLMAYLSEVIRANNVRSVLEIGSGGGLNLLLLSDMFPDVHFYGLEPTSSGVSVTRKFLENPPAELGLLSPGKRTNVTVIQGSILRNEDLEKIKDVRLDLVFTSAVLEQLHNYIPDAFSNIFRLNMEHFFFYEEWLEANCEARKYKTLAESDYFRHSISVLNEYPAEIQSFHVPVIQPSWLSYGVVFGKKKLMGGVTKE